MINYWWVTRPKRRLNSIPEVLTTIAELSLDQEWEGQRGSHLDFEQALENANLKRKGDRRDQTGGGARTYIAWVASLGLIFKQDSSKKLKLTLAGEAIMSGMSPVAILKNQVLKYQFPSAYSLSRGVNVSQRFKIRPFKFLLKLLANPKILHLSEEEIAKIVIVEAENETDRCYEKIVNKILLFRDKGNQCLDNNYFEIYAPSSGVVNLEHPYSHLLDISNTIINWLEYTQLAKRSEYDNCLRIIDEKQDEVMKIISNETSFIDRPEDHEYFQRKFGLDLTHHKDTRNLAETKIITAQIIAEQKIKQAFIIESLKSPIVRITVDLIDKIVEQTGINAKLVEESLVKLYPHGAIGSFMTEYFEMAFKGRDEATGFEKATVVLFEEVFGFKARHVGPIGLTPDVLLLSDSDGFSAILDNKAYSKYTISNDHHNRMVHNYIENLSAYYNGELPLAFFSYIAGGFGKNIDGQILEIVKATNVHGSAISVTNMIQLVERYATMNFTHKSIKDIFSVDRQIMLTDLFSNE